MVHGPRRDVAVSKGSKGAVAWRGARAGALARSVPARHQLYEGVSPLLSFSLSVLLLFLVNKWHSMETCPPLFAPSIYTRQTRRKRSRATRVHATRSVWRAAPSVVARTGPGYGKGARPRRGCMCGSWGRAQPADTDTPTRHRRLTPSRSSILVFSDLSTAITLAATRTRAHGRVSRAGARRSPSASASNGGSGSLASRAPIQEAGQPQCRRHRWTRVCAAQRQPAAGRTRTLTKKPPSSFCQQAESTAPIDPVRYYFRQQRVPPGLPPGRMESAQRLPLSLFTHYYRENGRHYTFFSITPL